MSAFCFSLKNKPLFFLSVAISGSLSSQSAVESSREQQQTAVSIKAAWKSARIFPPLRNKNRIYRSCGLHDSAVIKELIYCSFAGFECYFIVDRQYVWLRNYKQEIHAYFLLTACHLDLVEEIRLLNYFYLWLSRILELPVWETFEEEILGAVKY